MRATGVLQAAVFLAIGAIATLGIEHVRHRSLSSGEAVAVHATDPGAFVTPAAHALVVVDLRPAPVRALLDRTLGPPAAGEPCALGLARRTETLVVLASRLSADAVAVAATGSFDRAELLACARAEHRAAVETRTVRYRTHDLVVLDGDTPVGAAIAPATLATIVGRTVLYGDAGLVLAMLDHASGADETSAPTRLAAMVDALPGGAAVRGAFARGGELLPDAVPAAVTRVGLAISPAGDGVTLDAVLGTDDFDGPRHVADALATMRASLAPTASLAGLRSVLDQATVERRATDVRVHLAISAADLTTLRFVMRQLTAGSGPAAP